MFSKESIRRAVVTVLGVGLIVPLSALTAIEAHAETLVQVVATGTVQVMAVDGRYTSANVVSIAVGDVLVPVSDPSQASSLFSGDQVSIVVDIPTAVIDNLSADDQAAVASQPVIDGVTQVDGSTALAASLLQQTLAVTETPEIVALTVDASPATEPLLPPMDANSPNSEGSAPIGGTPMPAEALNQTVYLVIAFPGSDASPWITDAAAKNFIAQVQAYYRKYTGKNFTFTVATVKHLTNAASTICGSQTVAGYEMDTAAATLFGRPGPYARQSFINPDRIHMIILENGASSTCQSVPFVGFGTVTPASAVSPGYNTGGSLVARIVQTTTTNNDPLYSVSTIAHELGHNFGFNHSDTLMCSSTSGAASWSQTTAGTCVNVEYGDFFDFMGQGVTPGAIGPTRKYQSGLLAASAVTTIDTKVTNQSVTLTMQPSADNAAMQLIYVADSQPATGTKDKAPVVGLPYTVELRRQSWYDDGTTTGLSGPGFAIMRADRTRTWLLQQTVPGMSTSSPPYGPNTLLTAGATLTSLDGLITFTAVSVPAATCTTNCTGVIRITRNVDSMKQFTISPDMTSDGRGETLAVDSVGNLWLYPGLSTGLLGSRVRIGTGFGSYQVFGPGDVNSDGKADVFGIDTSGNLWLFAGNGTAIAAKRQIGNGWTGWRLIPSGDLTGDGKVDLLGIDSAGDLYMYAGKGDGTFRMKVKVGNGWNGWLLYAAGDLNGDGKTDILGINGAGDLFQYLGKGNGTFKAKVQAGNGWTGYTLAAGGDLNGDGLADILGKNNTTTTLYVYLGQGNAKFAKKKVVFSSW